jgi:hypothetical protein
MTVGLKQCIKLHNGDPYNLYSSMNIIRAIKYKVTWFEYSTRTGDMTNACRSLVGTMRERDHLRDLRMRGGGGGDIKVYLK